MSYFIDQTREALIGQQAVKNGEEFKIWAIPNSWPGFLPIGKIIKVENEIFLFSAISPDGRDDFSILDLGDATCFVHFGSMRNVFEDRATEFQNARENKDILLMRMALDYEQKREKTSYHSAKTMRVTDVDGDSFRFVREYIKEAMISAAYETYKEQSVAREKEAEKEAARQYAIGDVNVVSEREEGNTVFIEFSEGISLDAFYDYIELVRGERVENINVISEDDEGKKWKYSRRKSS